MIYQSPYTHLRQCLIACWLLSLCFWLVSTPVQAADAPSATKNEDAINTDCTDLFPEDPLSKPLAANETDAAFGDNEINTDCTDLFPEDPLSRPHTDVFSFLDTPQQWIYNDLDTAARHLDAFFANQDVLYAYSGSHARFTLDTTFNEAGEHSVVGKINISVRLPNTERKLHLLLESDPTEAQTTLQRATTVGTEEPTPNVYAGVQNEYAKREWRFSNSLGAKLRFPPDYYVRFRAARDFRFADWNLLLTESLYWYKSTGTGIDSVMNWDHLLRNDLLFRSDSLVRYTWENERFDLSQTFTLSQTFSYRRILTYYIGFFANTDPNMHMTDYVLQLRYRQLLHSNNLFMELIPQRRYSIDNSFSPEDSFLLRLEWLFIR